MQIARKYVPQFLPAFQLECTAHLSGREKSVEKMNQRSAEESYDSLNDPHLAQYFKRPNVRSHLVRAGLINELGHVIPGVTKNISQQRKVELKKLLNEAINLMKNGKYSSDGDDVQSQAILTHLSCKLSSLDELKQLESMLRAYLVLEAKKSYTRKPLSGYKQLTTLNALDRQERKKIHFSNNLPSPPANINPETVEIKMVKKAGDTLTSRSTPVSPISMYALAHSRPKSTYGQRKAVRYSHETTGTSVSNGYRKINGHSSKVNTSPVTSGVGVNSEQLSHVKWIKSNSGDNGDLEIISLSDSDSWSHSSSSPSFIYSDCPSYHSPTSRLQSSSALPTASIKVGASNYRHQSSSPFTSSSHRPTDGTFTASSSSHIRKSMVHSISPHFYQRHTCCSRASKQSIHQMSNNPLKKVNCQEQIDHRHGAPMVRHCNKKIPSAMLTLKYEVKCNFMSAPPSLRKQHSHDRSMKLLKIYQQLYRGSASFLVCARYINSQSVFKFTVYRREVRPQDVSTFSLSIFFNSIRETRISTCCEFKHQAGSKISPCLTIVSVRSLLHSSDVVCNVCVKGLLWSDWLARSLLSKEGENAHQDSTEHESKVPGSVDEDKIDAESRISSCSVLSETDYKEELARYSQPNDHVERKKVAHVQASENLDESMMKSTSRGIKSTNSMEDETKNCVSVDEKKNLPVKSSNEICEENSSENRVKDKVSSDNSAATYDDGTFEDEERDASNIDCQGEKSKSDHSEDDVTTIAL